MDFPLANRSTATNRSACYDVFISHRGKDVKKSLASLLYHSLRYMGLHVFLDFKEIDLGDNIPDKIQYAILSASVHIAIFSENYAQSPWCLAELTLMLRTGVKFIPVFYYVALSFPRHCKGAYDEAFREHQLKGRYSKEQIAEWKEALKKASFHSGWELNKDNDDLGKLWKNIVDTVFAEVRRISSLEFAPHPVGLDGPVQNIKRMAEFAQERRMNPKLVVIVGKGGSGKTTLARLLFNRGRSALRTSFLVDGSAVSATNMLQFLERKLLNGSPNGNDEIDRVIEDKEIVRSRFARLETSPFLIILDDIDHADQVDALLEVQDVLPTDSLIIITTRDRNLFRRMPEAMFHVMKRMDEKHARELFCLHAFQQCDPVSGFETLVEGFLRACDGLPLLLKVLGRHLFGKKLETKEWDLELLKLLRIAHEDIKSKLQISYDALDTEEKKMFVDVACLFIGSPEKTAIQMWNASGWSGEQGLRTLRHKCLVEVDRTETLRMHDLLRDLGRDIAAADPDALRCLPKERKVFQSVLSSCDSFGSCEVLKSSSDALSLKWEKCPHKSVSTSWIPLESLRHLEIVDGELKEFWQRNSEAPLQPMRKLIIPWYQLTALPMRFESLTNLQHIDLIHGCKQLQVLPESFSCLTQLPFLDLRECRSLPFEPRSLSLGQKPLTQSTYKCSLVNQIVRPYKAIP